MIFCQDSSALQPGKLVELSNPTITQTFDLTSPVNELEMVINNELFPIFCSSVKEVNEISIE